MILLIISLVTICLIPILAIVWFLAGVGMGFIIDNFLSRR